MKASPGPDAPATGTTQNAIQLSYQPNSPGTLRFVQQPNNRGSVSYSYNGVDIVVVFQDATYQTYSTTSKFEWDSTATARFGGLSLCGCKDTDINGQNLHRAANLFAQMLGQPAFTLPPLDTTPGQQAVHDVQYYADPAYPSGFVFQISCSETLTGEWVVFNTGLGLANPIFFLQPNEGVQFHDGADPDVRKFVANASPGFVHYCITKVNGWPGPSADCTYELFV